MDWPWIVTSATRPSSTAWRNWLKLISGSRGCCLVTIDQRSRPISRRRSQRPRLRETGLFKPTPPEDAPGKNNTRSRERQSSVRERRLDDCFDHTCRFRSDRRGAAARESGDPQDLAVRRQNGDVGTRLARDFRVDED